MTTVEERGAGLWAFGPIVVLAVVALVTVAGFGSTNATSAPPPALDADGVYLRDCATCHGADAGGSTRGPSLQGTGAAAVDYQLTTGRMPLPSPDAESRRRTPAYDAATIAALVQYVTTLAPGGPEVPTIDVAGADLAAGGDIYRQQCAACHQWAGQGGALEHGEAPPVHPATPTQIAEAVRTGPGTMPVFGEQAISSAQLVDLVGYVRSLDHPADAGGAPLWHLGPLAEGAAALLALAGLVIVLRMIGSST